MGKAPTTLLRNAGCPLAGGLRTGGSFSFPVLCCFCSGGPGREVPVPPSNSPLFALGWGCLAAAKMLLMDGYHGKTLSSAHQPGPTAISRGT